MGYKKKWKDNKKPYRMGESLIVSINVISFLSQPIFPWICNNVPHLKRPKCADKRIPMSCDLDLNDTFSRGHNISFLHFMREERPWSLHKKSCTHNTCRAKSAHIMVVCFKTRHHHLALMAKAWNPRNIETSFSYICMQFNLVKKRRIADSMNTFWT